MPDRHPKSRAIPRVPVSRHAALWLGLALLSAPAWAISATSTALTLTAAGAPVSAVTAQTVITLTATVQAAGKPTSPGQVNFCDATAKLCSDIHLLGTAQLLPSGTAMMRFTPGPGTHSYRAVFAGTNNAQPSSSAPLPLSVTGIVYGVTSASIGAGGSPGRYTLNSTVAGSGHPVSPSGTISFIDTSYGNAVLVTAPLVQGMPTSGLNFFLAYAAPRSVINGDTSIRIIQVADFNNDGKLDAAVTDGNVALAPVSVLLGNGDGTMTPAPPVPIPAPEGGEVIAVADFNGDGIPDIVVNLYTSIGVPAGTPLNELQVLLGKGDGTFSLGQVIATPDPTAMTTGDFNGDGVPDLALSVTTGHTTPGYVIVFLGKGDGTFTAASGSTATGFGPNSIVVGDFNQDGKADLAVANSSSNTVTMLLNNGDGTFTPSLVSLQNHTYPVGMVAADFNKDGILDLAVLLPNLGSTRPTVTILLGNGDGTFTHASDLLEPDAENYQQPLTVGDFNGDGNVDLAFVTFDPASVGGFPIAFGNGNGTFAPTQSFQPCGPLSCGAMNLIAAGDFNSDGLSDIASDVYANNLGTAISGGSISLATTAIESSAATSPLITLPPGSGTHLVYASYPGDSTYPPEMSGLVALSPIP